MRERKLHLTLPSVKVSPEAHSTPNMATMSPAPASAMSSSSLLCIRTRRGTCPGAPRTTLRRHYGWKRDRSRKSTIPELC